MKTIWYIVGVVIIAVLGLWYFSGWGKTVVPPVESSVVGQVQVPGVTTGNTTADIANDLKQTPDTSAALNADASASAQAVSGL